MAPTDEAPPRHHRSAGPSAMAASAGRRLLLALAACAVLWTAIAFALDWIG